MDVGFVGLGSMGRGMVGQLLAAGHAVTVWNRSEGPARELADDGAKIAADAAAAARMPVLLSMLADDRAVRAVLYDQGVLAAMPEGAVHVNHATVSVELARELQDAHAQRGLRYVAAPVFGRPDVAAAGSLQIVTAGAQDALEAAMPLLEAMAARVWPLGEEPVRANAVKLAGNFMLGAAIESMAEASTLARAYGVEAGDFLEIMTGTLFAAPAYRIYGELIAEKRFEPAGFKMSLGLKDIGLALAASQTGNVPLPLASLLRDNLLRAMASGGGDLDWAALARVAAERAGLD